VLIITHNVVAFVAANVSVVSATYLLGWFKTGLVLNLHFFNAVRCQRLVLAGLPFVASGLALSIYGSIDNIILGFLSRPAVVGWYGAAYTIISVPVFIPSLMAAPLLPALSRQADDMKSFRQTTTHALTAVLFTVVPICAVTIAMAPTVPTVLHWTADFKNSVPLMQILALHQPMVGWNMMLVTALIALHGERNWLRVTFILAILNPASNLVLIPVFERYCHNGAIGASIATVGTEVLSTIGVLLLLPRGVIDKRIVFLAVRVVLVAVCLGLVVGLLRPVSAPAAVLMGCLVYAGLGVLLQIWKPSDLSRGYRLARESFGQRLASKARALEGVPFEPGVDGLD
jgi:O-antigen/teichoic acid export membrane protein